MFKEKKLLAIFLAIICIIIVAGAYIANENISISDNGDNDMTINDSIPELTDSDKNGTIWLEDNGTLKEVNVTEASANGSASS